jgi:tryptophanyl-tRNA synthetase
MTDETTIAARRRVLSGMRPTGRLHLGNYVGALKNWVELQNATHANGSPKYECYFFIADFHALTTDYADTNELAQNVRDVALDFLAAGLDPNVSTVFVQSKVPAHFVLNSLLEMITPLSWLERVPTYKDQQEQLKEKDLATIGFLGYPVLQSADILVYQADFVPVGQDQAAHVEITREIARRFNHLYGTKGRKEVLGYEDLVEKFGPVLAASMSPDRRPRLISSFKEEIRQEDGDPQESTLALKEILPEPKVLLTPSPEAARDGWAQDVEELWEHDSAERSGGRGAREAEDDGDRPGAHSADRPGEPGCVPGLRSAQGIFERREAGGGACGMHDGGHRVHPVQGLAGGCGGEGVGADSGAARALRGESG